MPALKFFQSVTFLLHSTILALGSHDMCRCVLKYIYMAQILQIGNHI